MMWLAHHDSDLFVVTRSDGYDITQKPVAFSKRDIKNLLNLILNISGDS